MKEQMRAQAKIKKAMRSVLAGLDLTSVSTELPMSGRLLTDLTEIVPPEDLITDIEIDDVSWGKLAGKLISQIHKGVWRWRTRALHGAKAHYLRAGETHLRGAVERHFDTKIPDPMLQQTSQYGTYVTQTLAQLDTS